MNTNAIQISPILGTDSLSSSRIVINDNFKILANILENYQEYFNEDGVYSSTMISKNEEGTIDFKTDENHTIMELSSSGIEINGKLVVNGEEASEFEKIKTDQIDPFTEGTPENPAKILLNGNVEIQGNLSVSGDVPGGDGETVLVQNINDFQISAANGYSVSYNKGCYISPISGEVEVSIRKLSGLIREEPKKLIQFINKPFVFCGKGIKVKLDDNNFRQKIITNGKIVTNPDSREECLISPELNNYSEASEAITVIKIYPVVSNILEDPIKLLKFEFSTTLR